MRTLEELPWTVGVAAAHASLAYVAALVGDLEESERLSARATASMPAVGTVGSDVNWTALPLLAVAQREVDTGDLVAARASWAPILDRPDLRQTPRFNWTYKLAAAQTLGGPGEAEPAFVTSLGRQAEAMTGSGEVHRAWHAEVACRLSRSRGTGTSADWELPIAAWHELRAPWHEACCRLALADVVLDENAGTAGERQRRAEAELRCARRLAADVGALPLVSRIDDLARRARIRLTGQRAGSSGVADLTERETEVLRLLVQGRTNEQIGSALYMSPKTASVHVSRIIAKLGAVNRTEVAGLAHRLGLVADVPGPRNP
jgi:DNA-binding CsgD family transcriptional regulator